VKLSKCLQCPLQRLIMYNNCLSFQTRQCIFTWLWYSCVFFLWPCVSVHLKYLFYTAIKKYQYRNPDTFLNNFGNPEPISWSSYASAVLGIVILSLRPCVCLSVTGVLCDKRTYCRYFDTTWKVITLCFLIPTTIGRAISHSTWNLRLKWFIPLKNADFDQYLLITSEL